jgi:pSer/pThr/pTyr-binding forkhead associated (FHA) protein
VNGQRIQSQRLKNGDVVELGEVRLHFRVGD